MRFVLLLILPFVGCKETVRGPDVAVVAGKRLGALVLGQKPITGADGQRRQADGATIHYWSALGLEARVNPAGLVEEVVAHGTQSDPFFAVGFVGKTQDGLGPGSPRPAIEAALGKAAKEEDRPSAFGPSRTRLRYNGIAFDIDKASSTVLAVVVFPRAPP